MSDAPPNRCRPALAPYHAGVRVLSFSGTPQTIGEAFGETCRPAIHELYERRLANAIGQAREYGGRKVGEAEVLRVAAACVEPTRVHHPDGFAELEGIARGADLSLVAVLAMNGLTDLRDVLAWGGELESLGTVDTRTLPGALRFMLSLPQERSGARLYVGTLSPEDRVLEFGAYQQTDGQRGKQQQPEHRAHGWLTCRRCRDARVPA